MAKSVASLQTTGAIEHSCIFRRKRVKHAATYCLEHGGFQNAWGDDRRFVSHSWGDLLRPRLMLVWPLKFEDAIHVFSDCCIACF